MRRLAPLLLAALCLLFCGDGRPAFGRAVNQSFASPVPRIESYISGGQINLEVSLVTTADAYSVSNDPAYLWSVSSTLGLQYSPSTGIFTLLANGSSYAFPLAAGWRNQSQLDVWFQGGGGQPLMMQYRSTYTHGEGYTDSGLPIVVLNGTTAASISASGQLFLLQRFDASATLNGTFVGLNLHMSGGRPTWSINWPIAGGSVARNWIAKGDSLTFGAGSSSPPTTGYPARTLALLGTRWQVTNLGITGQQMGTGAGVGTGMLASISSDIYAHLSSSLLNVVTVYGGINDIIAGGLTGAQTYALNQQYYASVRKYCANASTASAWQANHTYASGDVIYDSVSTTIQQTLAGGTSGASGPPTFSATVNVRTTDSGGVVWASSGLAKPSGVFSLKLGAGAYHHFIGSNGTIIPSLNVLIRAGAGVDFDFLMFDQENDSVLGQDTNGTGNPFPIWRISDHLHGNDSYYSHQASLATSSLLIAAP